jgi:hypothetical protein
VEDGGDFGVDLRVRREPGLLTGAFMLVAGAGDVGDAGDAQPVPDDRQLEFFGSQFRLGRPGPLARERLGRGGRFGEQLVPQRLVDRIAVVRVDLLVEAVDFLLTLGRQSLLGIGRVAAPGKAEQPVKALLQRGKPLLPRGLQLADLDRHRFTSSRAGEGQILPVARHRIVKAAGTDLAGRWA